MVNHGKETSEQAPFSPNFHSTPTGECMDFDRTIMQQPPPQGEVFSSTRLELANHLSMTLTPRLPRLHFRNGILYETGCQLRCRPRHLGVYWDAILKQHVRLLRSAMEAELLFMDDNAHPYRANIVIEFPYGLARILTGLESSRSCVGDTSPTRCNPSTTSYMPTETSETIA
ncbi:uncharacterized protein TNCV_814571 [Trichonephila clavipes]|nr:uncharacterized protein TNCV_814571 [Trichonephila clavipes]